MNPFVLTVLIVFAVITLAQICVAIEGIRVELMRMNDKPKGTNERD